MNVQKTLLASSFCAFYLVSYSFGMMVVRPERQVSDKLDEQASLVIGQAPQMPLILRLRSQVPTPTTAVAETITSPGAGEVIPSASSTCLTQVVPEQFNKMAPLLAMCAFAMHYANIFAAQRPAVSPAVLAQLTPNERRLYGILQENEQIKTRLKSLCWHTLFSFAMLSPKFNESYEALQDTIDSRQVMNLLDPHQRACALTYLNGRFISKAKSFFSSHLSKMLVSVYRCVSPTTAHPSTTKSVIDFLAMSSICTVVAPNIVNYCTQPNSLVAIMAREKAVSAYNYLPATLKYKFLALKNWWNTLSP